MSSIMPIYEYKCRNEKCNNLFEELIIRKDQSVNCPKCGSFDLEKLISLISFKVDSDFKGSVQSSCGACYSNCSSCYKKI